jgi:FkbM family methyltransferase
VISNIKKQLLFTVIRFNRFILRKNFIRIFSGRLKGFLWTTASNYDYLVNEYEDPEVLNEFFSWLKADSVLYDIGANSGYYALLAAQQISGGKIFSFEPLPANAAMFKDHIRLNQSKLPGNVIQLQEIAISDREGEISFSDDGAIEGNTYVSTASRFQQAKSKIMVKITSIDTLVDNGLHPPDVIKIDVEGAEFDVLVGARKVLQKIKPRILLATHDCHLPGVKDRCIMLLQEMGYSLRHTGYFNKYADGHDDYIAVHPDNK